MKPPTLPISASDLIQIAGIEHTPFYAYSRESLLGPVKEFKNALAQIPHQICFALKACPNLSIVRLLGEHGVGADVVSGGELHRARAAGIPGDRIVFSGVGKSEAEIESALGIHSLHVESMAELDHIESVAARLGRRACVALRLNPDVNPKTHPYISTGLKKNKFGLDAREVIALTRVVAQGDRFKHIDLQGLSIHIGSQIVSLGPFDEAFRKTRQVQAQVEKILARPLSFMDLGGGLGVRYRGEKPPTIAAYCNKVLKYFGPGARGTNQLTLFLEPGRTIAAHAGVLVTKIILRKKRGTKDFLVVDAAMNDLIRPALYGSYHEIVPLGTGTKKIRTDVVGPACESADTFAHARPLPQSLGRGDFLAICTAGAYGASMSSNYNSRSRIPEILVEGRSYRVIRARETIEDQIKSEMQPSPTLSLGPVQPRARSQK